MSRWEFMRQLEELLSDISPNEREEALQYYNDYFNDAGRENEQEVIRALGSPEQVAEIVREGLEDGGSQGEFTENGFLNRASSLENEIIKKTDPADSGSAAEDSSRQFTERSASGNAGRYSGQFAEKSAEQAAGQSTGQYAGQSAEQSAGQYAGHVSGQPAGQSADQKKELPVWAIVLIVIGCIIASPVILSVVVSLAGTLFGALCAMLGIILGLGVATLLLFVVAAALVIAGFGCMLAHPLTGVGLLGGGCICGALGILFLLVTVFLVGKGIPALCKGIAYVYHWIVDRVKGVAA